MYSAIMCRIWGDIMGDRGDDEIGVKVTGSLAYDVSEITEEAANANTKIISIDSSTYPKYKLGKIFINIKGWHDVAEFFQPYAEILTENADVKTMDIDFIKGWQRRA